MTTSERIWALLSAVKYPMEEVTNNLLRTGFSMERVQLVKGDVLEAAQRQQSTNTWRSTISMCCFSESTRLAE